MLYVIEGIEFWVEAWFSTSRLEKIRSEALSLGGPCSEDLVDWIDLELDKRSPDSIYRP
jgi:hypothetical protein